MVPIVYTKDLDSLFFPRLDDVCERLSTPESVCLPRNMVSIMKSESDVRANAHNDNPKDLPPAKRYNAVGLIQFMPATLPGVGWNQGWAAMMKLSATEQLPFVQRYFMPYKGKLGSIGQIYTATFLPAYIDHAEDPDYVLTASSKFKGDEDTPAGQRLGWAFGPNAGFDDPKAGGNGDYAIQVRELEAAVRRNCTGARWKEILMRLGEDEETDPAVDEEFDLRTIIGMQRALLRLGYNVVGKADGYLGPKTSAAVAAFQKDRGIKVDGIYGPETRKTLEIALQTSA